MKVKPPNQIYFRVGNFDFPLKSPTRRLLTTITILPPPSFVSHCHVAARLPSRLLQQLPCPLQSFSTI
ncbi:hypothetical protein CCACVL1_14569 [Corchorus capsularis]|uniref:Uncharacterized protein n=1 Tax=Corchorus capsularis TaxID=210143 RepID=A0A1R3I6Q4_COCAP|nr:hypothetical protein CCACVL1_14569 [Corchorus capsularis]